MLRSVTGFASSAATLGRRGETRSARVPIPPGDRDDRSRSGNSEPTLSSSVRVVCELR
ncbi:hypothetical protein [Natrarchaeobius oligotrophus]|uniref:hypothetical protein n=1 Tax=Natrarchaeobius oligotrophus TaxID=3455743 RepID=UPI0014050DC8|nr:hypothetical protein [Natrarchaeobius chitinivorans]